jgi:hypothetical protein
VCLEELAVIFIVPVFQSIVVISWFQTFLKNRQAILSFLMLVSDIPQISHTASSSLLMAELITAESDASVSITSFLMPLCSQLQVIYLYWRKDEIALIF